MSYAENIAANICDIVDQGAGRRPAAAWGGRRFASLLRVGQGAASADQATASDCLSAAAIMA